MCAIAVVVTGSPAAAVITTGCPAGTQDNCYAQGRLYQYNNLQAVGGNLEVDCLAVINRAKDFANMEMWLHTATNRPQIPERNWVEEGMTSGTLYSSPGHEQGFIWFWADNYGDTGQYFEHYIQPASVNTYTNVTFRWQSNAKWGIYRANVKVGESGAGPYPGESDLGGESTTYQAAIWGHGVDYQYQDAAGTWHWIKPATYTLGPTIKVSVPAGTGRAAAKVNISTPTWVCGGSPPAIATPATAPAEDPATLLKTEAGTTSLLRSQMALAAATLGVPSTGSVTYVKSTRDAAAAHISNAGVMTDSGVSDTRPVYVVQTHGSFTKAFGDGRAPVTGDVLEIVVDAQTGLITDWGITRDTNGFESLGISTIA